MSVVVSPSESRLAAPEITTAAFTLSTSPLFERVFDEILERVAVTLVHPAREDEGTLSFERTDSRITRIRDCKVGRFGMVVAVGLCDGEREDAFTDVPVMRLAGLRFDNDGNELPIRAGEWGKSYPLGTQAEINEAIYHAAAFLTPLCEEDVGLHEFRLLLDPAYKP